MLCYNKVYINHPNYKIYVTSRFFFYTISVIRKNHDFIKNSNFVKILSCVSIENIELRFSLLEKKEKKMSRF